MSDALEALLQEGRTFPPPAAFRKTALDHRRAGLRRRRARLAGLLGPRRRSRSTGRRSGTRSSSGSCRSRSGSSAASSTSRTTASTATSTPVTATRSRSTGRASPATRASLTYAELLDETCRVANALRVVRGREGRPGRDLHGHGARDGRRTMLACARIGAAALGRVRRLHRAVAEGPHQRRRSEGARHRRRRVAARRGRPAQGHRRRSARRDAVDRARARAAPHRERRRDAGRPRRLVARRRARPAGRVRVRVDGQRRPALPPLHVGHHRQAQGHHAHDRRLPHAVSRTRTSTCSTCTPTPTCTGAPPTSAGSPATRTSSTGRSRTARRACMYEGTPDYPDKDRFWSIVEKYKVTIFYTAPTAIRTFMKWGDDVPGAARPVVAAAARHRRRADQPRSVGLVLQDDRRRALPGGRHVVADRDRRHHDQRRCPARRR